MNYRLNKCILVIGVLLTASCSNPPIPKPRGFQRIDFPRKVYQLYQSECPFSAYIPVYSDMFRDSLPGAEKCWFNLVYPSFNATLHLSYKTVEGRAGLNQLIEDSRTLVYKHTIKADEIYETIITNHHLSGMLYNLSGNTATNFQFYVTDSVNHFLRGSLYFNVKTNMDSIQPVLSFLEQDIIKMIESMRWGTKRDMTIN